MNRLAKSKPALGILIAVIIVTTATLTSLLVNMVERKTEARQSYARVVEVGEDDTNPVTWKAN